MSFFNRIRPDPGFVSPIRSRSCQSDPIRSGPVRSGPVRSGPVRSPLCQRPKLARYSLQKSPLPSPASSPYRPVCWKICEHNVDKASILTPPCLEHVVRHFIVPLLKQNSQQDPQRTLETTIVQREGSASGVVWHEYCE